MRELFSTKQATLLLAGLVIIFVLALVLLLVPAPDTQTDHDETQQALQE